MTSSEVRRHERWAVITPDRCKGEKTMLKIILDRNVPVIKRLMSKSRTEILFEDGVLLMYMPPFESARGYKLNKAWVDSKIDSEYIDSVVKPLMILSPSELHWI